MLAGTILLLGQRRYRRERSEVLLLALTLAIPPLAVWFITRFPNALGYSPRLQARYFFPYAPAYYLLTGWAALALAALCGRWRRLAAGVLLVGLLLIQIWGLRDYYAGRFLRDDYQSVALTLRAHAQPEDAVLLHTDLNWPAFAFYWPRPFAGRPQRSGRRPRQRRATARSLVAKS